MMGLGCRRDGRRKRIMMMNYETMPYMEGGKLWYRYRLLDTPQINEYYTLVS